MTPPSGASPKRRPSEHAPGALSSAGEKSRAHTEAKHAASHAPLPPPMTHAEVQKVFFGLMLTAFLAALNQTIIATALPTIGRHFADFENLSWVVTAYLLTSTAVATLYGKLSDIYGRRAMILTATGIFVAGSAACAVAPNMLLLVLGRALQGIGGGGILPIAQAIIADVVAPRERGRYQAYMGVVWVTSGVGGPVLGGVLSEHFHWSLIFWLNVPLGLIAAFLTQTYLKRIPRHERKHELDILGAGLMMASAVPLLLALSWGGVRYNWLSPAIISLIIGSLLLSFAFAWRLSRAPEPFLPLAVLHNPVMRMGTLANSFAMATSIALTIFTPLYFEVVYKLSATDSGFALIPLALTTPGSLLSGRAMLYGQHYKWVPIVGLTCSIVVLAFLAWNPAPSLPVVIAMLSIIGTAIGMTYPVSTVSIQNAVAHHQVGVAMGTMNFFRSLTSAFAVAVMGAIILAGFGAAPERGTSVSVLAAAVGAQGFDVAGVFRWVFLAALIFLAISLLALLLMEERPLRGSSSADPQVPAE
jgi:EmrB/QacA subfamily drug resistance transporter